MPGSQLNVTKMRRFNDEDVAQPRSRRETRAAGGPQRTGPGRKPRSRRRDPVSILLGAVGELLITVGVFLGLFVVWQVWWTDLEARRISSEVVSELAFAQHPDGVIPDDARRVDEPAPLAPEIPGDAFAVLHIPRLGADYQVPIAEGVGLDAVLHRGLAGHYPDTAELGQIGNFAIAGHRQSHGAVFRNVDQLEEGDALVVATDATWYVYRVTGSRIVLPTAVEVIAPVPGDESATPTVASMTLTTCHPLWSTAERYIVHAELDYWAPKEAGVPAEMEVS